MMLRFDNASLAIIVPIAFLILVIFMRWLANRHLEPLVKANPIVKGGKSLVVLVHGTRGRRKYLDGMYKILEEVRPDADILTIEYPSSIISNADNFHVSEGICGKIHEARVGSERFESNWD